MIEPIRCSLAAGVLIAAVAGCDLSGVNAADAEAALDVRSVWGEVGRSPGQFVYPRGMDLGEAGLWIVDKTGRVQLLEPDTGLLVRSLAMPTTERGLPTGLTVGPRPDGSSGEAVWVADTHEHRVLVFEGGAAGSREPVASFGSFGRDPGGFVYVTDIAVLTDDAGAIDRVYVSEYGGNDRVTMFDSELRPLGSFGSFGVGDEAHPSEIVFNRPQSVAIDAEAGELIVADACNHRLGRFTLDGELVGWIGSPTAGLFEYPYGLAVLPGSRVLVAEFGANRVSQVDLASGEVVTRFGVAGRGPGELASPWGVSWRAGTAWVLDSANNRVQSFRVRRRRRTLQGRSRYARDRGGVR